MNVEMEYEENDIEFVNLDLLYDLNNHIVDNNLQVQIVNYVNHLMYLFCLIVELLLVVMLKLNQGMIPLNKRIENIGVREMGELTIHF